MTDRMEITFLNPNRDSWPAEVHGLRTLLGAPNNPHLFPHHFLEATFPRIGGQVTVVKVGGKSVGAGFLFPRSLRAGLREFTLRFHQADPAFGIDQERLTAELEELLGRDRVVFYDPQADPQYERTTQRIGEVDVGKPDAKEALAARSLQQEIWGSEYDDYGNALKQEITSYTDDSREEVVDYREIDTEYGKGISALESYLHRLTDDNQQDAQFYSRADNLSAWLGLIEKRLGSLSQRLSASVAMGIAENINQASAIPGIPKIAIVSCPSDSVTLSAETIGQYDCDLVLRMISVGQPHRAIPVTGALCTAVAGRIEGTLVNQLTKTRSITQSIRIAHPSGVSEVDAEVVRQEDGWYSRSASINRTARRLMDGYVYVSTHNPNAGNSDSIGG